LQSAIRAATPGTGQHTENNHRTSRACQRPSAHTTGLLRKETTTKGL